MPRAQRDLAAIYEWIDANSSGTALIWYQALKDAIGTLRDSPNRCPMTPEDVTLRHLLHGNKPHIYRVIHRVWEPQKLVQVLHIRHGARQAFDAGDLK